MKAVVHRKSERSDMVIPGIGISQSYLDDECNNSCEQIPVGQTVYALLDEECGYADTDMCVGGGGGIGFALAPCLDDLSIVAS